MAARHWESGWSQQARVGEASRGASRDRPSGAGNRRVDRRVDGLGKGRGRRWVRAMTKDGERLGVDRGRRTREPSDCGAEGALHGLAARLRRRRRGRSRWGEGRNWELFGRRARWAIAEGTLLDASPSGRAWRSREAPPRSFSESQSELSRGALRDGRPRCSIRHLHGSASVRRPSERALIFFVYVQVAPRRQPSRVDGRPKVPPRTTSQDAAGWGRLRRMNGQRGRTGTPGGGSGSVGEEDGGRTLELEPMGRGGGMPRETEWV